MGYISINFKYLRLLCEKGEDRASEYVETSLNEFYFSYLRLVGILRSEPSLHGVQLYMTIINDKAYTFSIQIECMV
jgi:hypothetical protein